MRPVGSVETFEHTADVGLRVRGADLDDLFQTAAAGLLDYIVANRDAVRDTEAELVALAGDDPAELLVTWLNELIFRCETRHRLYTRFDVQVSEDGRSLQAEIGGEAIDRQRHVLDHEVKAVTRHGVSFEREGDGWVAELILDI
jgi:SHS2 domain-containing protein